MAKKKTGSALFDLLNEGGEDINLHASLSNPITEAVVNPETISVTNDTSINEKPNPIEVVENTTVTKEIAVKEIAKPVVTVETTKVTKESPSNERVETTEKVKESEPKNQHKSTFNGISYNFDSLESIMDNPLKFNTSKDQKQTNFLNVDLDGALEEVSTMFGISKYVLLNNIVLQFFDKHREDIIRHKKLISKKSIF